MKKVLLVILGVALSITGFNQIKTHEIKYVPEGGSIKKAYLDSVLTNKIKNGNIRIIYDMYVSDAVTLLVFSKHISFVDSSRIALFNYKGEAYIIEHPSFVLKSRAYTQLTPENYQATFYGSYYAPVPMSDLTLSQIMADLMGKRLKYLTPEKLTNFLEKDF